MTFLEGKTLLEALFPRGFVFVVAEWPSSKDFPSTFFSSHFHHRKFTKLCIFVEVEIFTTDVRQCESNMIQALVA